MAGQPKKREKAGLVPKPWAVDPSLSSRPPFLPGNLAGLKSGAESERVIGPVAAELAEWLVAEHPDLDVPRYALSVAAWSWAEARTALLRLYLDSQGVVGGDGEPRERILRELRAEERRASEERARLGLSPVDHARLEKQRAEAVRGVADLSGIKAEGRKALDRHRERVSGDGERLEGSGGTS
jgi:hypothetical protein